MSGIRIMNLGNNPENETMPQQALRPTLPSIDAVGPDG
jgi:hypothetical protein